MKRKTVDSACSRYDLSIRRSCGLFTLNRSSYYCKSHSEDDGLLRTTLKDYASMCRRRGYRRLTLLLHREGFGLPEESGKAPYDSGFCSKKVRISTKNFEIVNWRRGRDSNPRWA